MQEICDAITAIETTETDWNNQQTALKQENSELRSRLEATEEKNRSLVV
jgi:hypothetical protein